MSAFFFFFSCLLHMHGVPQEEKKKLCNGDLSFHFYDFPRILWRAWKDRHVYEGFQMVLLAPPAFLFSSWAMKD